MTWLEEYMSSLTERERQVVELLSRGMAPKQIARQLGTRTRTVRNQLYNAKDKAGCDTIVQLAVKVAKESGG
jgi:DNA-binding CsgD family transcriptional regulator